MENSGFNTWVLMGDEMHYVRVILVVTILIGNGKNGDTLVLHFGGKKVCMSSQWTKASPSNSERHSGVHFGTHPLIGAMVPSFA